MHNTSQWLGVGETSTRRWIDELRFKSKDKTPLSKVFTRVQQQVQYLQAYIYILEQEKENL